MEGRKLNVSFNKTGNGYLTPKLSLPKSDLENMEQNNDIKQRRFKQLWN